jgi:hypothetical protein
MKSNAHLAIAHVLFMDVVGYSKHNQLEEVVRIPSPVSYGQLRLHPWWDPLRDDPRFEKLVEEAKKPVAMK